MTLKKRKRKKDTLYIVDSQVLYSLHMHCTSWILYITLLIKSILQLHFYIWFLEKDLKFPHCAKKYVSM
jgi:hypothetical protein